MTKGPGSLLLLGISMTVATVLVCLAVAFTVLSVRNADWLMRFNLVGQAWYLVLLLIGFAFGLISFVVLKKASYARFEGKWLNGTIQVGGPIVMALAVIVPGFWFAPTASASFDVTVFVRGTERDSTPLRSRGEVVLDLGSDRRHEAIGRKGEARFQGIPATLRGQRVRVALEGASGYQTVDREPLVTLAGDPIYLPVEPKPRRISGRVLDSKGQVLGGALVVAGSNTTQSDSAGRFELSVLPDSQDPEVLVVVSAIGHLTWRGHATPGPTS